VVALSALFALRLVAPPPALICEEPETLSVASLSKTVTATAPSTLVLLELLVFGVVTLLMVNGVPPFAVVASTLTAPPVEMRWEPVIVTEGLALPATTAMLKPKGFADADPVSVPLTMDVMSRSPAELRFVPPVMPIPALL
jgi:hypothetical protein